MALHLATTSKRLPPRKPPCTGGMSRCRATIRRCRPAWSRCDACRGAARTRPPSAPDGDRRRTRAGPQLQPALKPGQRLVTRAGDLWRWDGFTAAAEGAAPAAQRLAERNRLSSLELEEAAGAHCRRRIRRSRARRRSKRLACRPQRGAAPAPALARGAEPCWPRRARSLTAIERAARETESKLAAVSGARARAEEELVVATEMLAETEQARCDARTPPKIWNRCSQRRKREAETRRMALAEARAAAGRSRARTPRAGRSRHRHRRRTRALDDARRRVPNSRSRP